MKKIWLLSAAMLCVSAHAVSAQNYQYGQQEQQVYGMVTQQVDPLDEKLAYMQKEWARIKYQVPGEDSKIEAIHRLENYAAQVNSENPGRPEAMIWEGIILSTDAGITKSMSGLPKVKRAKELFETALSINPNALDGSAYTSLGSLYYQVPGWPIAFGDDDKAEESLKNALAINPTGIDPNFFYGDFLLEDDRYDEAKVYLERALQAAPRPDRPLADAGRKQEIKAALASIQEKEKTKSTKRFNQ